MGKKAKNGGYPDGNNENGENGNIDSAQVAELESELMQRNREIAKVRDQLSKEEKKVSEERTRTAEQLEKIAELDGEVTKATVKVREAETVAEDLKLKVEEKEHLTLDLPVKLEKAETRVTELEVEVEELKVEVTETKAEVTKEREVREQCVTVLEEQLQEEKQKTAEAEIFKERLEEESRDACRRSLDAKDAADLFKVQFEEKKEECRDLREQVTALKAGQSAGEEAEARCAFLEKELKERDETHAELVKKCEDQDSLAAKVKELQEQLLIEKTAKQESQQKVADLEGRVDSLNAIVAKAHEQILDMEREKEQKRVELEKERNKNAEERRELEEKLDAERRQAERALKEYNDKMAALSSDLETTKKRLSDIIQQKSKIQQIAREKDELEKKHRQRILELEMQLKTGQAAQRELEAANIEETEAKLKERTQRIEQLEADVLMQRQRCESLESERTAAEAEKSAKLRETENQNLAYENELTELRGRIAAADQSLESKKEEMGSTEKKLEEARESLQTERQRCTDLEAQVSKCQRDRETEVANLRDQNQQLDALLVEAKSHGRELEDQVATVNEQKAAEQRLQDDKVRRLEADLNEESEKRRQIEEKVKKMHMEHEQALSETNVRLARRENELASKAEKMTEVDGRLDAQRQYMERLQSNLHDAQEARDEAQRQVVTLEERSQNEHKRAEALDAALQRQREEETVSRDRYERELASERAHREEMLRTHRETSEGRMEAQGRRIAELEEQLSHSAERNEVLSRLVQASQMEAENNESSHRQTIADLTTAKQVMESRLEAMDNELQAKNTQCDHIQQENEKYAVDLVAARKQIEETQKEVQRIREDGEGNAQASRERTAELDNMLQAERQQRREMEERWEQRVTQKDQDLKRYAEEKMSLQKDISEERQRTLNAEASLRDARDVWNLERQRHLDQVQQLDSELQNRGQQVALLDGEIRQIREDRSGLQVNEQALSRQVVSYQDQLRQSITKAETLSSQLDEKELQIREAQRLQKLVHDAEEEKKSALAELSQVRERLAMQSQELQQRRVETDLELKRIRGALDESRKVLRDMNFGPRMSVASDPNKLNELERQLAAEKMKVAELTVQKDSREHKLKNMEENYERQRTRCEELSKQLFNDEKNRSGTSEELANVKAQKDISDRKADIMRERMAMVVEECSVRTSNYNVQIARLRGQLEESRYLQTSLTTSFTKK